MHIFRKIFYLFIVILLLFPATNTEMSSAEKHSSSPQVLVIFSSTEEGDSNQRVIDLLLSHFTNSISFTTSDQVKEQDIKQADFVFYYGQQLELLPIHLKQTMQDYQGKFIVIGHNIEQWSDRFSFLKRQSNPATIDQIIQNKSTDTILSFHQQSIFSITLEDKNTETLLYGKNNQQEFPLFVKNGHNYYFASDQLIPPFSIPFAEILHEIFEEETHSNTHPGYIRLEDVHPLVEPDKLMDIAELLKEREIPYMIAVIPIYTNPVTKKQHHFSDSPKLLKTLKYMQENGASIVLHGYTHQFRLSETGEGFEFWDVEHNMPIYHEPDEANVVTKEDFSTEENYKQYVQSRKPFERNYIEKRLEKGIQELANYGLYPLAFEAPHYTMSQQGYEVTSEYFSTYVGQLQISDDDWMKMTTSPYITNPSFLHGMKLLPETIGYVHPLDELAIEKMVAKAQDYTFVEDGMVAGFYHPYLGVDRLEELLDKMEEIPNIQWIDLKAFDNQVETDYVSIHSNNGEIVAQVDHLQLFLSSKDYLSYHLHVWITRILWGMVVIGSAFVLIFLLHTLKNARRNNHG